MTLDEFRREVIEALTRHFPRTGVSLGDERGIALRCKAELDTETLIAIYFNSLTNKTCYALIRGDQRLAGFDNYRFWHYHPPGGNVSHLPCREPSIHQALEVLAQVYREQVRLPGNQQSGQ